MLKHSLCKFPEKVSMGAYFIRFELGWFYFVKTNWKESLQFFEEVFLVSIKSSCLSSFQKYYLKSIPNDFLNYFKNKNDNIHIILPYNLIIGVLIGACYSALGNDNMVEIWLNFTIFLIKKNEIGKNSSSNFNDNICKICQKFLKRKKSSNLIIYELLYFLKEIVKLGEKNIKNMINLANNNYFFNSNNLNQFKDLIKPENSITLVEFCGGNLLKIIGFCILNNYSEVYIIGEIIKEYSSWILPEFKYILHHSFYWVGRAYFSNNCFKKSKEFLLLSKKLKKCEFSLIYKVNKLLLEIQKK